MRRLCLAVAFCLLFAAPALAQATLTSVTVLVIPQTGDPLTVAPITCGAGPCALTVPTAPTATICGKPQGVPATGTPVNPTLLQIDNPYNTATACELSPPTGIPNGTYRFVSYFTASGCVIPPSTTPTTCDTVRSNVTGPFQQVQAVPPPAAPTGARIIR